MNSSKSATIILGAGFSKPAGLPLASELNAFFTRDNSEKLLHFSSGEWKWVDFADDVDLNNGRLTFDHVPYGFILNLLVTRYTESKGSFISYEDFYQYVLDNIYNREFLDSLYTTAQKHFESSRPDIVTNAFYKQYIFPFSNRNPKEIRSLINHLIADLLFVRKSGEEVQDLYKNFILFIEQFENLNFVSLNHDLLIEYFLKNVIAREYSDGFSIEQKTLRSSKGESLNTFQSEFSKSIIFIKLHGSIDMLKYIYVNEKGSLVTETGEYMYYKSLKFDDRQMPERFDSGTGKKVQSFHFEISPQFITGTRKEEIIGSDSMYSVLYKEFKKRINENELLVIIGYSFMDEHVNEQIKKAIDQGTVKEIICVNPSKEFPFSKAGLKVTNYKSINELQ